MACLNFRRMGSATVISDSPDISPWHPENSDRFELVKQRISEVEDQQRKDSEALRRREQIMQGSRRSTEPATSGDTGWEIESRVEGRISELECRVFGRRSTSMEPRMGRDVGATSPQVRLNEYKIVGPGDLEVAQGGDATALAKATYPVGILLNATGNTDGRATMAGWGVGGPRDLSEQQQQEQREERQQQQQQQTGQQGAGRQQQQQQHERQQGQQQPWWPSMGT